MWWLFVGIVAIFIAAGISTQKNQEEFKKQGYKVSVGDLYYVSGFPDKEGGKVSCIQVHNEKIEIYLENRKYCPFDLEKTILKPDLINCEIISQQQLEKEISLGRVLLLGGVGGLLFKKDKVKVQNFLKITYKDKSDNEKELIFTKDSELEKLTKSIREVIAA